VQDGASDFGRASYQFTVIACPGLGPWMFKQPKKPIYTLTGGPRGREVWLRPAPNDRFLAGVEPDEGVGPVGSHDCTSAQAAGFALFDLKAR